MSALGYRYEVFKNRHKLKQYCERLEAQITLGQFDFANLPKQPARCGYFTKLAEREADIAGWVPSVV